MDIRTIIAGVGETNFKKILQKFNATDQPLGCGNWACAFPTPHSVVKITGDEKDAAASALIFDIQSDLPEINSTLVNIKQVLEFDKFWIIESERLFPISKDFQKKISKFRIWIKYSSKLSEVVTRPTPEELDILKLKENLKKDGNLITDTELFQLIEKYTLIYRLWEKYQINLWADAGPQNWGLTRVDGNLEDIKLYDFGESGTVLKKPITKLKINPYLAFRC